MADEIDLDNLNMLRELLDDKFGELVDTFLSDSSERLEAMRAALAVYDLENLRRETHGLKGSCRNIGANPVADLCQIMEDQAHDGMVSGGEQQMAAIEQKIAAVSDILENAR